MEISTSKNCGGNCACPSRPPASYAYAYNKLVVFFFTLHNSQEMCMKQVHSFAMMVLPIGYFKVLKMSRPKNQHVAEK